MHRLAIQSRKKRDIVDITAVIEKALNHYNGRSGTCHISILHTTAALTTADLDPGTDLDMLDAFEEMIPKLHYRHPHNPAHVPDHILSSLIGTSVAVAVDQGRLLLGTWQRIVLVELDGPRQRDVVVAFSAED
ncbi:MAG: YjbQ family protein [Acidobacteria bacterium]|nr:YjbQ family protein [Acidobacteriota bacterium]